MPSIYLQSKEEWEIESDIETSSVRKFVGLKV